MCRQTALRELSACSAMERSLSKSLAPADRGHKKRKYFKGEGRAKLSTGSFCRALLEALE